MMDTVAVVVMMMMVAYEQRERKREYEGIVCTKKDKADTITNPIETTLHVMILHNNLRSYSAPFHSFIVCNPSWLRRQRPDKAHIDLNPLQKGRFRYILIIFMQQNLCIPHGTKPQGPNPQCPQKP